ncbi:MAG: helix-turn-helix transcriptional regulator [Clostridia bacterium]|nr:helix-turn-helix transcriptional regulator [Clostridia bacterium]
MRNCSEHVRQALLIIESELASPLSLADIARALSISPTHLARIFHRDTGKTVVEHIQDCRVRQACHLLKTTNLQIQTVAQHCGMMDVQYFSKIFKKITGSTPKVWREQARGGAKEVPL